MATTLKCRVCGKTYEACRSTRNIDGIFRWKDVACSPEHGAEYLSLIRASRSANLGVITDDQVKDAFELLDSEYASEFDDDVVEGELDEQEDEEIEV